MNVSVQHQPSFVTIEETKKSVNINVEQSSVTVKAPGLQGPIGPVRPFEAGVLFLKNNSIATPIASVNGRAVVSGNTETGKLINFEKDTSTNSLKYTGKGGVFHAIATFNFFEGSQTTCGFYIGHNKNPLSLLDANADRISESEIYINASTPSNQPQNGAVQTVLDLAHGDRLFFIVQNKTSTTGITVQFLKLVVRS
jgi:hypothetical protein